MAEIHFGDRAFDAELIIFDKDGTLMDFAELWAHYTVNAVEALMGAITEATPPMVETQQTAGVSIGAANPLDHAGQVRAELYATLGYDPAVRRFDPQSPVVTAPLPTLYTLAAGVLYRHGWGWLDAELLVEHALVPAMNAPLQREMVQPTANLPHLFDALVASGVKLAVVTSDDREPTLTALNWMGVSNPIAFIACADDGYAYKPAPEAIWAACQQTGVDLARTVMVGDSTTDMLMGQRAGVGLRVAVLTGIMDATVLAPHADVVLSSVGEIQATAM